MQDAYELAAKIIQFHCKTNILHSVFTLKSRIRVVVNGLIKKHANLMANKLQ
ncbi:MAG: hypothetical protein OFPII_17800 [Osedax symbiont Rs1]|nr:MAG: hypothetical protein OFPII_17800 [Osedax symbiont Rs1]